MPLKKNRFLYLIFVGLVSFAAGILWFQPRTLENDQPTDSSSQAHSNRLVDSSGQGSKDGLEPALAIAKSPSAMADAVATSASKTPANKLVPVRPVQDKTVVALQTLIDLPLTGDSETELLSRLRSWSEDPDNNASQWIETTLNSAEPESSAYALRHSLLYLWLEIEPEVAILRLESFADADELPYLIGNHVGRLADEYTSQYALNWAESSTAEGTVRSRAVEDALDHWLTHDVDGLAAELLVRIDEEQQAQPNAQQTNKILNNLGERLVDKLAENDPGKALNWAERLPADQVETAQERVTGEWLKQDTGGAARHWLDSELADTGTLPSGVASAIPSADIELALATWDIVEDPAREAMTKGIVETLSATDPIAAQSWVDSLDDPLLHRNATRVWIGANASELPNEALAAALASPQDADRPDLLVDTAVAVAANDPQLLRDWLANAPLTELNRTTINTLVFDQ